MIKKFISKNIWSFLIFIFATITLLRSYFYFFDPDFGWHIKTGELILKRGIPRTDWFSYTMPNFPWIDHEWLTNVSMFKIYSLFGYFGLALISAIIVAALLVLIIPRIKKLPSIFFLIPLILVFWELNRVYGIRPQIITAFFLGVFWLILSKFNETKKFKLLWFLPILTLLWANLHGGFILGIFLLFLILGWQILLKTKIKNFLEKFFKIKAWQKKEVKRFTFILFISLVASLINPYGGKFYEVALTSVGNSYYSFFISEWLPLPLGIRISGILYLFFFITLTFINHKRIDGSELLITYSILVISFLHQLSFPLFLILSAPIMAESIYLTSKEKSLFPRLKRLYKKFGKLTLAIFLGLFMLNIGISLFSYFVVREFAPSGDEVINYSGLAEYLKNNSKEKVMFNDYDLGGFLIWQVPEKKVFIDGRMLSWEQDNLNILKEYNKIVISADYKEIFKKYNIKQVVLGLRSEEDKENKVKENGIRSKLKNYFFNYRNRRFGLQEKNLIVELKKNGWTERYKDFNSIVLEID